MKKFMDAAEQANNYDGKPYVLALCAVMWCHVFGANDAAWFVAWLAVVVSVAFVAMRTAYFMGVDEPKKQS